MMLFQQINNIERLGDFALQRTKHLNLVNPHIPSSEVVLLKKCYTEKVEKNKKSETEYRYQLVAKLVYILAS